MYKAPIYCPGTVEGVHEIGGNRNTSEHNMGPAGYIVKLEQWEEEDRQFAAVGIPNPYDAYPDDRSKNWL
jgi:hypothetical protein